MSNQNKTYSFSSISALVKGDYYPNFEVKQILDKANFGIGTFEGLNGELIVIKNQAYQLIDNNNVILCTPDTKIAYAFVCNHTYGGKGYRINNISKTTLENKLIQLFETKNLVQAIYGKAIVEFMHSRTVKKQERPYQPMATIIDSQSELQIKNVEVELVGFYTPSLFSKIGVDGFHWHYISNDKKFGGHVFDMNLKSIDLVINSFGDMNYYSPNTNEFLKIDLEDNSISESIKKVEKK